MKIQGQEKKNIKCEVPDLTALMTSFNVGIISSRRISGGKPRSSKAGSAKAPASEAGKYNNMTLNMTWSRHETKSHTKANLVVPTFRALSECVGLHAEGGAEAFPVTEAGWFGLLGGTFFYGVGVTREPLG